MNAFKDKSFNLQLCHHITTVGVYRGVCLKLGLCRMNHDEIRSMESMAWARMRMQGEIE